MKNIPEPFVLSDGEKMHTLWARLKEHLQAQLHSARVRNDNPKLTEAETCTLRGQITCLKGLIALGDDRPQTGD